MSHLGKAGLSNTKKWNHLSVTNTLESGYASIASPDSNQILKSISTANHLRFKKWMLGLKISYTDFSGLIRVNGKSIILTPEVGFDGPDLKLKFGYSFLQSEQFKKAEGFQGVMSYRISEYFTIEYFVQRWLPTEYLFFTAQASEFTKPLYMSG